MLLYHGGAVQFLQGLPDDSIFMAPELVADRASVTGRNAVEKVIPKMCMCFKQLLLILMSSYPMQSYVYSLGMTMFAAMQNGLEDGQVSVLIHPNV